jgi:hypothetical protein
MIWLLGAGFPHSGRQLRLFVQSLAPCCVEARDIDNLHAVDQRRRVQIDRTGCVLTTFLWVQNPHCGNDSLLKTGINDINSTRLMVILNAFKHDGRFRKRRKYCPKNTQINEQGEPNKKNSRAISTTCTLKGPKVEVNASTAPTAITQAFGLTH